jgi:methylthioribulose-1-phosphate dehydratase
MSYPAEHPRNLIPEMCRLFYNNGWATGTGGGMSIRDGDLVYVAPSGVQKERVQPDDIFVLNREDGAVIELPKSEAAAKLKQSECTPLFFNAYRLRNAGACLHTHSQSAVLATMLFDKEFRISHVEMIKGIVNPKTGKAFLYCDTLVIPIIDNTNFEADLCSSMAEAMEQYPESNAVLVRRHGVYVWGDTWQKAKTMAECYDYLFNMAIEMKKLGLSTTQE